MGITRIVPWVFLTGILQFQGTWSSVGTDTDMPFDETCKPTDCSQRAFEDGNPFPCVIGMQKECDAAKAKYKSDAISAAFHSFAFLATVGTYGREYPGKNIPENPSLNFSLTTPYGGPESLMTKAIQVDFNSPRGHGEDAFYRDNPRCRIFDFSNATRKRYDISYAREIKYKCLVGLSIANIMTYYYEMKLTSLPSHATTVYSIVVHSMPRKLESYRIVVAVAAIAERRSVHAVWEQPNASFPITSYNVTLSANGKVLHTKITRYGDEKWEFNDLQPGDYTVKVEPKTASGSSPCGSTISRPSRLLYITDPSPPSTPIPLKTVLAAVSGIVVAVILLVVILFCYKRKIQGENGPDRVLIVSHRTDDSIVTQLSAVITQTLGMEVNQLRHVTSTGIAKWLETRARHSAVLIICSAEAAKLAASRKNNSQKDFCKALSEIEKYPSLSRQVHFACVDQRKKHEHIDLFCNEKFFKSRQKFVGLNSHKKVNKVYCLRDDFTKLGKKLGRSSVDENYKLEPHWARLMEELNKVQDPNRSIAFTNRTGPFSVSMLSHEDSVSQFTTDSETPRQILIPRTDDMRASSVDDMEETGLSLSLDIPQGAFVHRRQTNNEEFASGKRQSTQSNTERLPHYPNNFQNKASMISNPQLKKNMRLDSLREEDIAKSCITLQSGDIQSHDMEEMLDSGFMSGSSDGPCGTLLAGHNKDITSALPAHSQLCGGTMPQNTHDFMLRQYDQHYKMANNFQVLQMDYDVRNGQSGDCYPSKCQPKEHQLASCGHHRNLELEASRYYYPHITNQPVSVDSGHFKDDSGFFNSEDVSGHLLSSGQSPMFKQDNPKRPTTVIDSVNPLQGHPMPLNQNPLFNNRQISRDHGSVNEDELFSSGVSTPLLNPQHMSPVFHSETERLIKPDADQDTVSSARFSFFAPDSDNGSYTSSSDWGYCIQQDETGQEVLVPKAAQGQFTEARPVAMGGHLGERHSSAPEDIAEHTSEGDIESSNQIVTLENPTLDAQHHYPGLVNQNQARGPSHVNQHHQLPSRKEAWSDQNRNTDKVQSLTPAFDQSLLHHDLVKNQSVPPVSFSQRSKPSRPVNLEDAELHPLPGQVHHGGLA